MRVRTKHEPGVHGPPLWTRSMDHLHGPGPWTLCYWDKWLAQGNRGIGFKNVSVFSMFSFQLWNLWVSQNKRGVFYRCLTFADCTRTAGCRLQTADCRLQIADRRPQTADCRPQIADSKLKDTKNLPNKGDTIKNITSCERESNLGTKIEKPAQRST